MTICTRIAFEMHCSILCRCPCSLLCSIFAVVPAVFSAGCFAVFSAVCLCCLPCVCVTCEKGARPFRVFGTKRPCRHSTSCGQKPLPVLFSCISLYFSCCNSSCCSSVVCLYIRAHTIAHMQIRMHIRLCAPLCPVYPAPAVTLLRFWLCMLCFCIYAIALQSFALCDVFMRCLHLLRIHLHPRPRGHSGLCLSCFCYTASLSCSTALCIPDLFSLLCC